MTGTELYEALSFGTEDLSNPTSITHTQTAALWLTGCSTSNSKAAWLRCHVTTVTVRLYKSFKCFLRGGKFHALQLFPHVKSRNVTSNVWERPTGVVRIPRVARQRWVVYVDLCPVALSQLYITPYRAIGATASNQTIALWRLAGWSAIWPR